MRKPVMALAASLFALLAVPALAVDGTLSSASKTYAWEGGPMNGFGNPNVPSTEAAGYGHVRCSDVYECDNEHIEIKEPGGLVVDIKAGEGSNDLDVRLFASDAQGTAPKGRDPVTGEEAKPVAEDIRTEKDAKITAKNLKPGFYVIQVAAYDALDGMYNGTATFTPAAPAAAAPAPGTPTTTAPTTAPTQTSPTPAQNKADDSKRRKALAKCSKKAKKVKNKKKRKAAQKKCAKKYAKKKA